MYPSQYSERWLVVVCDSTGVGTLLVCRLHMCVFHLGPPHTPSTVTGYSRHIFLSLTTSPLTLSSLAGASAPTYCILPLVQRWTRKVTGGVVRRGGVNVGITCCCLNSVVLIVLCRPQGGGKNKAPWYKKVVDKDNHDRMRDDFVKYVVGATPDNVEAVWTKYCKKWRSRGEVSARLMVIILSSPRH
jgi:hypothetical protein